MQKADRRLEQGGELNGGAGDVVDQVVEFYRRQNLVNLQHGVLPNRRLGLYYTRWVRWNERGRPGNLLRHQLGDPTCGRRRVGVRRRLRMNRRHQGRTRWSRRPFPIPGWRGDSPDSGAAGSPGGWRNRSAPPRSGEPQSGRCRLPTAAATRRQSRATPRRRRTAAAPGRPPAACLVSNWPQ